MAFFSAKGGWVNKGGASRGGRRFLGWGQDPLTCREDGTFPLAGDVVGVQPTPERRFTVLLETGAGERKAYARSEFVDVFERAIIDAFSNRS